MRLEYFITQLEKAGVVFAPGLTHAEIQQIEREYKFRFPPDLKTFLMFALPINAGFLDWRNASKQTIVEAFAGPYEGICFDIEHNTFWLDAWGNRPFSLSEACAIARDALDSAPTLIPINGHRYIPDCPHEPNNPIFSVYQTDIIYYGTNLADYLENEFRYYFDRQGYELHGPIKEIEFWSEFTG